MNFVKKILPIIIAAIVFGIAGYFIGVNASARDQAASVFNAGPAAASAMCQKYPNDPRCKGAVAKAPDVSIQMASAMCQKFPNDPRCKGGFTKSAEKAAMISWFCQNNPKDSRCSQNTIGNTGVAPSITLGACIRAKGVPQIDAQDNYAGCTIAK